VTATVDGGAGMTVTLIPDVQVLKVQGDVPEGGNGTIGANTKFTDLELAVTLALKPRDAEKLIHAKSQGEIHLALLPPGEKGDRQKPMTFNEVIGR
jgi:Flp pilus assembly protein CpaB